ncbi:MAG: DUF1573 domain-containing protein [Bacteroidota bacterium]
MKTLLIALLSLSVLTACNNGSSKPIASAALTKDNAPVIKFDSEAFDFGKIKTGDKVTHEYKFKNEGKSPLIISDSYATCGCTKPEWPHTPIKPGESGTIKVTFSSEGKSGLQDKQVTVVANTLPANTVVHLVGEVIEKK